MASSSRRNVLTLITGTALAQGISIAITPIITRIYTPESFGVFALYVSIVSLISVIATGRYELAIMLPQKKSDAIHLVLLSFFITCVISVICFVVIFLFGDLIIIYLGNSTIEKWLYCIPVSIMLSGFVQSLRCWNNRCEEYKAIAISRFSNSAGMSAVNLSLPSFSLSKYGLVSGYIVGQSLSVISVSRKFNFYTLKSCELKTVYSLAKKYKTFPMVNSIHAFVNVFKLNVVNIILIKNFTETVLGQYFMVLQIMQAPSALIGASIAQVFYRDASVEYKKGNNIQHLVKQMILKLVIFSSLPACLMFFFSEPLFVLVFGPSWSEMGGYAHALLPYIYLHFIVSPLGMVPLIIGAQVKAFYWGVLESGIFICVFVVGGIIHNNITDTLQLLSFVFMIYFSIYIYWIIYLSGNKNV
ncbi:oligosaccharide flippase family protein [Moritella sp. 24]|uniref:lipopolysaccharide biosynthesis protein n=1 Tax=Moritella sp. 24 TaxID=2746230 RepID=UPI001BA59B0B|nr:oligosaccharide flippase family protein [Moritella sp. 24]QUM75954.1 oligosaccharide flippase family protein [Moritella sp. 24]